jgi:hypothetical protein
MGHGPSLQETINRSDEARRAVEASVKEADEALKNTELKAEDYINSNTKGIIQRLNTNFASYTKYASEYSLDVLTGVVDAAVKTAQSAIKLNAEPGPKTEGAIELAEDVGTLITATLALFASSESTTQNLQRVFSYILADDMNYAVYYATNLMSVKAKNAWGDKEITVITNAYMMAVVQPNPDITEAKVYQQNLDTVVILNKQFNEALINAKTPEQFEDAKFILEKLKLARERLEDKHFKALESEFKARLN